jgi:hypothetical protein
MHETFQKYKFKTTDPNLNPIRGGLEPPLAAEARKLLHSNHAISVSYQHLLHLFQRWALHVITRLDLGDQRA